MLLYFCNSLPCGISTPKIGSTSIQLKPYNLSGHLLKAFSYGAIFLATCVTTNIALTVARKISCVAFHKFFASCNTTKCCCVCHVKHNLQHNFVKMSYSEHVVCASWKISRGGQKEELIISNRHIASFEKVLRTCDTLSATCNVFHSSLLQHKLQEKLPCVTWH